MVSVVTRSLRLLVVVAAVVATASSSRAAMTPTHLRTLSLARELAGSSDGGSSPTIAPTPTTALPAPTDTPTAEPKTPLPTTEKPRNEAASGSKDAGATSAPPTPSPTPSPKKTKEKTPAPSSDEPPATVKTRSSVSTTTTTPSPVADEAGVTGNAALASGAVKSEYGTKAPANGDAADSETVSTSSAPKSTSGWIVPVIIGCVIVSALVVVTVYVRHKRTDDDDDDDDDVDDFTRRRTTNNHGNFMPHPRTTNHQMGFNSVPAPMNMHDLEPPLFKPSAKPANVSVHAVSMQPTTQPSMATNPNPHARKFSIPMLQSPVRASGESIDGRDTVTGSRESHHERITARFTSASMSGVTL